MSEYSYTDSNAGHTELYLWPVVLRNLSKYAHSPETRVLDLGCGNGAFTTLLASRGFQVIGVDPSESGIQHAKERSPLVDFRTLSAYEPLSSILGQFDVVVSMEVVEHLYSPRDFAKTIHSVLRPGGTAIVTTPYHGYWKNLALALTNRMDSHFTALWDHGHIKFWSPKTLTQLLREADLRDISFQYAGRVRPFSESMIAIAHRPAV